MQISYNLYGESLRKINFLFLTDTGLRVYYLGKKLKAPHLPVPPKILRYRYDLFIYFYV